MTTLEGNRGSERVGGWLGVRVVLTDSEGSRQKGVAVVAERKQPSQNSAGTKNTSLRPPNFLVVVGISPAKKAL